MRLGFDLHDGPLQQVYALAQDIRLLREQVVALVGSDLREPVIGRFADLESQLAELHQDLRDLAHSLEPRSLLQQPLPDAVERELTALSRRTGVSTSLERDGSFDALTASQRIALLRVLQEALSNVRQHSGASAVAVALREDDDGRLHGDSGRRPRLRPVRRPARRRRSERNRRRRDARAPAAARRPARARQRSRRADRGQSGAAALDRYAPILIGVPTGTRSLRRRIASFATRMHPCETAWPSSDGVFVPWIPTMPPPGHSLSFE